MANDIKTALGGNSGRAYSGLDEVAADEAIRRLQWIAFNFPYVEVPLSREDRMSRTVNFYCNETVKTLKLLRDENTRLREERYKLLEQRQWKSVKDEKPKESGEVIVYILGAFGTSTLNYDPENDVFYDDDNNHYNVTHWMPKPEVPEVEK